MTHREQADPELEAPPPDLRDLTLWAGIVDRERVQRPLLNPGPGTALELRPRRALSSAQAERA